MILFNLFNKFSIISTLIQYHLICCVALKKVTYKGYFCRRRRCRRPLNLVRSLSQSLKVGLTLNLVCMLLTMTQSAVYKYRYSELLIFLVIAF
jgi:hypothetical protein